MPAVKRRRRGAFLNAGAKAQSEIQAELNRASQPRDISSSVETTNDSSSSEFTRGAKTNSEQKSQAEVNKKQQREALHDSACATLSGHLTDSSVDLNAESSRSLKLYSEGSLRARALQFLKLLEIEHSSLFTTHRPPPLQTGIQKSLFTLYPAVPRKVIRYAIGLHTNRLSYLRSIRPGYSRYAIDMTPGPSVTEEEAESAKRIVISRKAKLQSTDID